MARWLKYVDRFVSHLITEIPIMMHIRLWPIPVVLLTMILYSQATWAAKTYVVEAKEIPLRSGPGTQTRTLTMLPPGSSVEILKGSEWTRVRYVSPEGETKDGWVFTRALGPRPPEETFTKELQNENAALNERLAQLEKEKTELQQKESRLSEQFAKLADDHEKLKTGSTNYLALRDEYEATKTNLASAQENIERLTQENDSLRLSQRVTWFGAGALVLFCGWLIGWFTGRHQRKRRIIYF
jgi:SH3 domain protein